VQRGRILACRHPATLERWVQCAVTAALVAAALVAAALVAAALVAAESVADALD